MNESQRKNKKHKQLKLGGTTCLSFSVALIAVFTLIVVGITGISYAFPSVDTYADSVTSIQNDNDMFYMGNSNTTGTYETINHASVTSAESTKDIFCINRNANYVGSISYTKNTDEPIEDLGLNYLLATFNSTDSITNLDVSGIDITNVSNELVLYWAGQAVVYSYLGNNGGSTSNYNPENLKTYKQVLINPSSSSFDTALVSTTIDDLTDYTTVSCTKYFKANSGTLFDSIKVGGLTLTGILEEANSLKSSGAQTVSLTITDTGKTIQTDKDKKYYFAGPYTINVNATSDFLINSGSGNITVSMENAPDGTKLVDKDFKEISDTTKLTTATNFYVRVPADKVTKSTKITLTVSAPLTYYTGYKYVANDYQTLAIIGSKNDTKTTGTEVELTPTGDTGMNVGQTVYFIGLIVLLCGVGIIYANAKPSQVKE